MSMLAFWSILCLICIVAWNARSCFNVGFVERPFFIGLGLSFIPNVPFVVIPIALFYELFWVERLPIGTYLPPFPAFSFLIAIATIIPLGWISPEAFATPLIFSLPLAYIPPYIETILRREKSVTSSFLISVVDDKTFSTINQKIIVMAVLEQSIIALVSFILVSVLFYCIFVYIGAVITPLISWPVLLMIACTGGVLSLRISGAYKVFIVVIIICGAAKLCS